MKQKNKLTISIGTTAFNEEGNIRNFLNSVCGQKEKNIIIKEIIVISDGSTDNTVNVVKKYQDKRVKLITSLKRLGKPSRLNQLFRKFTGDLLVFFDSDVILKDTLVVERLVRKFKTDENLGLVSGNPMPLPARTFIEKAINNFLNNRERLKSAYNFKNSPYAVHGRTMAFSKKFINELNLPVDILGDDGFSYLSCKEKGYNFCYQKKAVVWFRSPQTVKDYINQATRFLAGTPQLYQYFGHDLVDQEYQVPKRIKVKMMLLQLKDNPLGYFILKLLHFYCLWKSKSYLKQFNIRWSSVRSSKQLY